jgi:hypothetical protein
LLRSYRLLISEKAFVIVDLSIIIITNAFSEISDLYDRNKKSLKNILADDSPLISIQISLMNVPK